MVEVIKAVDKLLDLDINYAEQFNGQNSVGCTVNELEGFDAI